MPFKNDLIINLQRHFFWICGFVTFVVMFGSVAYLYAGLAFNQTTNVLLPLQALIYLGTFFTAGYCTIGFLSGFKIRSITTIIDLVFLAITIIGIVNDVFFVQNLNKQITLSLSVSVQLGAIIGLILSLIGFISVILYRVKKALEPPVSD